MFAPHLLPDPVKRCPTCGTEYRGDVHFCAKDGAALVAVAPLPERPPTAPPPGAAPQRAPAPEASGAVASGTTASGAPVPAPRRSRAAGVVAVLLGGVALAVGGYAAWVFLQNEKADDVERQVVAQMEQALAEGRLVEPEGESAYDWYTRLAEDFPASPRLQAVRARTLPDLTSRLDAVYERWTRTSEAPRGEWARTEKMAAWAVAMAPADSRLRAQRLYAGARLAFESGDGDAAEAGYLQAIQAWPDWALAYNSLGVLMADRKRFRAAANWYEEAIARDRNWAFPHLNLGGVYAELERYEDARRSLARAEELGAESAGAGWANLSNACLADEAYRCALDAARSAVSAGGPKFDRDRMGRRVRYLSGYVSGGYEGFIPYQEYIALVDAREAAERERASGEDEE